MFEAQRASEDEEEGASKAGTFWMMCLWTETINPCQFEGKSLAFDVQWAAQCTRLTFRYGARWGSFGLNMSMEVDQACYKTASCC